MQMLFGSGLDLEAQANKPGMLSTAEGKDPPRAEIHVLSIYWCSKFIRSLSLSVSNGSVFLWY